ncbi:soluble lytic murein transglycosylase-like protein [Desulfobaculum xiamenense]|uniref:Soluble lytic murein transglycosylase-like protein n=1 Tax=Desulfobaculum xiamenense TaxID=995050 RepID=A0A846QNC0_9BACT|nr:transglycosylase SLT domain-containing protein [Desulfobaculum xiamenense]NJB66905.1 soluble lytic murein transglycosylase-like protein [Desulfobaculum xiamenense]
MPILILVMALSLTLDAAQAGAGKMYYFVDEEGRFHFTNRPSSTAYSVFAVFRNFPDKSRDDIMRVVRRMSRRHGVDPSLVAAVIEVESNFEPDAISHKGAQGLMQIMPHTGRDLGLDKPFDMEDNIEAGVKYLKMQIDRFGDKALALAAYNAGPKQVERYGGIPPFPETRQYVRKVLTIYNRLKGS